MLKNDDSHCLYLCAHYENVETPYFLICVRNQMEHVAQKLYSISTLIIIARRMTNQFRT